MKKLASNCSYNCLHCNRRSADHDNSSRSADNTGHIDLYLYDHDRHGSDKHFYARNGKPRAPRRECKCDVRDASVTAGLHCLTSCGN